MSIQHHSKIGIWLPNKNGNKWSTLYPHGNKSVSAPTLITRLDLTSGMPNSNGWGFGALGGAAISVASDGGGNYLRGQYPAPLAGDNYIYGGYNFESLENEVYVQLYARMPGAKSGCKFVKLFGHRPGAALNYANITFAIEYASGRIHAASFGDGTTIGNDTTALLTYTNAEPWITVGRSMDAPNPAIITKSESDFLPSDWGTGWHKFQFMIKHSTGNSSINEVNNGVVEVRIDDVLKTKGVNLFTRHWSNNWFENVSLFGWSQAGTVPFELHIKDVTISKGGWVN